MYMYMYNGCIHVCNYVMDRKPPSISVLYYIPPPPTHTPPSASLQPAFSLNSKVAYDHRTHAMNLIKSTPLDYLMCLVYPRLYALHMLTENVSELNFYKYVVADY